MIAGVTGSLAVPAPGSIDADDSADLVRRPFPFFPALFLARDPLAGGIDSFDLGVERAACGGVGWCVAMEDRSAACAGTKHDDGAEEEQRFSLARGRHAITVSSRG